MVRRDFFGDTNNVIIIHIYYSNELYHFQSQQW